MADARPLPGHRLDAEAVEQRLARLDAVLGQLEQTPGRTAELAMEGVELLLDVYAEALARVGDRVDLRAAGLTGDDLVRHLLVLHGLHPDPPIERAARAVEELGGLAARHGATVELVGVDAATVHIGVSGSSGCGCGSAPEGLDDAVRDCLTAAAPELGVEITRQSGPRLIPVSAVRRRPDPPGAP
jgi:Fe-S cluster biogenesis protein NfuA